MGIPYKSRKLTDDFSSCSAAIGTKRTALHSPIDVVFISDIQYIIRATFIFTIKLAYIVREMSTICANPIKAWEDAYNFYEVVGYSLSFSSHHNDRRHLS